MAEAALRMHRAAAKARASEDHAAARHLRQERRRAEGIAEGGGRQTKPQAGACP